MLKSSLPTATRVRQAGPDHQVITLEGGPQKLWRKAPCAGCPFRIDQTGRFPADAFYHSAETSYDTAEHTFACHEVGTVKPAVCAGFLMRGAFDNLRVRIALIRGEVTLPGIGRWSWSLHDSYRTMAIANGCNPADARLLPCRSVHPNVPVGLYAGTEILHEYVPIPQVIGTCRRCYGVYDDPRHVGTHMPDSVLSGR